MKRALLGVVCLALLVPAASAAAHPHQGDRLFPPLSGPYGRTYPQWFSGYQVWWNSIPTPVNPAIDPESPRNCASRGPVVFGGPFGSGDGCRARVGQAFAFGGPGWECSTGEGLGETFQELRTCAVENYAIDFGPPAFRTSLRVDGELVRQPRRWTFVTPGETIDFPEDNIWGAVPGPSRSVSKGVFYIVRPMAVGRHRIVMRVFIEGEFAFAVVWKVKVVGHHADSVRRGSGLVMMTGLSTSILGWVEATVGPGARVRSVREMPEWSVQMHDLLVEAPGGAEHRLVLRRYTDPDHLGVDPCYDPSNEVRALELLEATDIPAPHLYGADVAATVCDVPAVLESWVQGEPADPHDVDTYLTSAAEILVRIHALAPSRPKGLPDYIPYAVADGIEVRPPPWTTRPGLWERVLEVLETGPPTTRECFIHRDYHQGNTLVEDDRVVAVIDWPTAAWGPPGIDLARMRLNLVEEVGPASERRFLEAYRSVGGDPDDRHPYWDLRDAADATIDLSHRNDLEGHDRSRFEAWVASVLAEL